MNANRTTRLGLAGGILLSLGGPATAGPAYSCAGFAMVGGAELACSHIDPKAPPQICSYSWALLNTANVPTVVQGSFLLPKGAANAIIYQGSGFISALSNAIVLCQGRKSKG